MSDLASFLPPVYALGWTLLHFVRQGAAIGLLYAAARPWLPSGTARHAGALGAMALLLLAPLLTLLRLLPQAADAAVAALADGSAPVGVGVFAGGGGANPEQWLPWLVGAWALGVVVLTFRALLHWRDLLRLMRHGTPLPEWEARLAALCRRFGIGRAVRLLWSENVSTPTLVGWLRPVILLPAAVALGFPAAQIELILAHELGHVRRWDYVVNLVQVVLETVLFYHPVVHWISRELRHEREICCDEMVLRVTRGHPHVYARTLASLEELRSAERLPLAVAASGGVLLERVQRVVGVVPTSNLATRPVARLLPLALAGAILATGMLQQLRRDDLAFVPLQLARMLSLNSAPPRLQVGDLAFAPTWSRPRIDFASATKPEAGQTVTAASTLLSPQREMPQVSPAAAPMPVAADLVQDMNAAQSVAPTMPAQTPVATNTPSVALRAPQPIKMTQPVYPESARERGVEGVVTLEFELGSGGEVIASRVISAQPERVFDAAAQQALRWWRYDPASIRAGARYQQNFVFSLGRSHLPKLASTEAVSAETECRVVTGSRLCRRPDGSEQSARVHGAEVVEVR
jgi:TonB family protein